jgi:endoglycosylceramidase
MKTLRCAAAHITLLLPLLAACGGGSAPGSSDDTAARESRFSQQGRWLVDAQGRVAVIHGVNLVEKHPPYHPTAVGFNAAHADFIAANGFNSVRLGLIYKALEPEPGVYDRDYLETVLDIQARLAARGVSSLLDFHQDLYHERFQGAGFPDWAVYDDGLPAVPQQGFPTNYFVMPALWRAYDNFWLNRTGPDGVGLQDRYALAWQEVARRVRDTPMIVGFDIFNEPFPGSQWPSCANPLGCPLFDAVQLTGLTRRVLDAVRAVDRERIVFYEPNITFNAGAMTHHGDLGDPALGMSFHNYCLAFTVADLVTALPTDDACPLGEQLVFDNAEAQSQRTGNALLLTEFGSISPLSRIAGMVDLADRNMISWYVWAYYSDAVRPEPDGQGIIRNIAQPPVGDNVNHAKLDLLVRPYPQAIAGTPQEWFFDRDRREFTLRYDSARVDGEGRFPAGARRRVYVPGRHYPNGYRIELSGARAERQGEETLILHSLPEASEVRLRLRPAP